MTFPDELPPSLSLRTPYSKPTMAMPFQLSENFCRRPPPLQVDFVRVGGRYRVGKPLGSGRAGESNSDSSLRFSDTSLASVYLGWDIMTGADVALKIGFAGSSLYHEYKMYTSIAGSIGTSTVLWYGKEDVYEVIVLE